MYTEEALEKYPYFSREMRKNGLENLLDPLTGLVTRAHILGFAQSLIAESIPFTFAMLDLDNFKFINDTYGHQTGDDVLFHTAEDLIRVLEGDGVAGRFGGDEYLIVTLKHLTYQEKKTFLARIYDEGGVLRKNIPLNGFSPFITGTVGCATFPQDAQDFDGLFSLIDKTLYRGKTKGRNCHIIYVKEKHANIEIRQIAHQGICAAMRSLVRQFEMVPGLLNKLRSVTPLLMEELHITDLYYVGKSGVLRAVRDENAEDRAEDIRLLTNDDVYSTNDPETIRKKSPVFYSAISRREIETVMVARVGMDLETDGYLICAEPRSRRIWQQDEEALIYFLAKLTAARIRIDGESLDG